MQKYEIYFKLHHFECKNTINLTNYIISDVFFLVFDTF